MASIETGESHNILWTGDCTQKAHGIFLRKKLTMDTLITKISLICEKEPERRTSEDMKLLLATVEFPKFLLEGRPEMWGRHIKYMHFNQGEYIFSKGEECKKLYIIITGKVIIQADFFSREAERSADSCLGETEFREQKKYQYSAQCVESTHLFHIDKCDYELMRTREAKEKRFKMVFFLHKIPFFNVLPRRILKKLTYSLREVSFAKHSVVYKEGDLSGTIYVLTKGEFTLYRKTATSTAKKNVKNNFYQGGVVILGPGEICGETELINEVPRSTTCICTRTATVLALSKEQFYCKIKDPEMLSQLKGKTLEKTEEISLKHTKLRRYSEKPKTRITTN